MDQIAPFIFIVIIVVAIIYFAKTGRSIRKQTEQLVDAEQERGLLFVKTYVGAEGEARNKFQQDAVLLASKDYFPTVHTWIPGQWSPRAFAMAILLILLGGVGLLVLAYMLLVKPAGSLMVTYQKQAQSGFIASKKVLV